jgi:hypothetical protein
MPIIGVIGSSGDRNVPDAPTIGTATNVGTGRAYNNGRADVTFTAPVYTGGTPITGYTVTSSPGGFTGTGASSPVSVTGLQSGVAYTFTVTASNAVGTSAPSAASNSITATTVPQAPTVTATDVGTGRAYNNGAATVTITGGATGGSAITSYAATSSPGSFSSSGASPLTVTGLASNTAYTFSVTATNANGTSAATVSNSITATTVPQAPTIGTATDLGTGTSVSVAFTGNATGGKAISTYTATSSPGSITGTGGSSPITVSGLTAGTAYTFTVTATNANGTSAASAASNSVTPAVPTSYESIASFTGDNSTSTVTFNSIPGTYKHLQIRVSAQMISGQYSNPTVRFNNDSGTNYKYVYIDGYGTTEWVGNSTTNTSWYLFGSNNYNMGPLAPSVFIIDLIDYASTSKLKSAKSIGGVEQPSNGFVSLQSCLYTSTSAISRIDIQASSGFATGSTIALYGIKG